MQLKAQLLTVGQEAKQKHLQREDNEYKDQEIKLLKRKAKDLK